MTITEKPELQQRLQSALGLPDDAFDYHATDLYVKALPQVLQWLREHYPHFSNVVVFKSQLDGKAWLDVPFAGRWPA